MNDTIYALSSGGLPSGVAIVRISGPGSGPALDRLCRTRPQPRKASLRSIQLPGTGEVIDRGLVLWMPGPATFTGEDVAEIHLHGSKAVVSLLFRALAGQSGFRPAAQGEFTRRAFHNGRLDLSQVEGLADLLSAETEVQRRQALRLADGMLRELCGTWRSRLIRLRASIEAQLDFSDEGDVTTLPEEFWIELERLRAEISIVSRQGLAAERVRTGYRVALMGAPNAGKSSLLNAIAGRPIAIVTDEAGTTRDVLEVPLDLGGYPVLLYDTAGLRDAASEAERAGVERARRTGQEADLVLWLMEPDGAAPPDSAGVVLWRVGTKADLHESYHGESWDHVVSATTRAGIPELLSAIRSRAAGVMGTDGGLLSRERHRMALAEAEDLLGRAVDRAMPLELAADLLRSASDTIGRISGQVDIEEVLESLFREFCIGK